MRKTFTNFVLNIVHTISITKHKTGWEGRTIRYSRLKKFKKKGRGLLIAAKILALWYLLILSGSYLTADTGAYFNDVETINGMINVSESFCDDDKWAEDHKEQCKDNSGLKKCEKGDDCEAGTDEDNPGHNKEDCGDHSNAPCSEESEISNLKEIHTSNSITLSWSNPTDKKFDSISIFKDGQATPIAKGIQTGQFEESNLTPNTKYSYKIVAVDKNGKELNVVTIQVSTDAEEKTDDGAGDKQAPGEEVPPGEEPPSDGEGEGTPGKESPPSREEVPGEGPPPSEGNQSGDSGAPSDISSP